MTTPVFNALFTSCFALLVALIQQQQQQQQQRTREESSCNMKKGSNGNGLGCRQEHVVPLSPAVTVDETVQSSATMDEDTSQMYANSRRLMMIELQILSSAVGVLSLLFLSRTLSWDLQIILVLWVISVGMLLYVGMVFMQSEYDRIRRENGLIAYLPDSVRRLLLQTSLHEWMIDPSFMLEYRHLALYFIPGLSSEQLDAAVDRLPPRHRNGLRRPGMMWMLPDSMQQLMLPSENSRSLTNMMMYHRSHTEIFPLLESRNEDNYDANASPFHLRQPSCSDGIQGIFALLMSPLVLNGPSTNIHDRNFHHVSESTSIRLSLPETVRINNTSVTENTFESALPQNGVSSDDEGSMDLGLDLVDEFDGNLDDQQARVLVRALTLGQDVAQETHDSNIRESESAGNDNVTSRSNSDQDYSEDYSLEGQIISDAFMSTLSNMTNAAITASESAMEYVVDATTPAVGMLGIGSVIGLGVVYIQPLLSNRRANSTVSSERSMPLPSIALGLAVSAASAGGFFFLRSRIKNRQSDVRESTPKKRI